MTLEQVANAASKAMCLSCAPPRDLSGVRPISNSATSKCSNVISKKQRFASRLMPQAQFRFKTKALRLTFTKMNKKNGLLGPPVANNSAVRDSMSITITSPNRTFHVETNKVTRRSLANHKESSTFEIAVNEMTTTRAQIAGIC